MWNLKTSRPPWNCFWAWFLFLVLSTCFCNQNNRLVRKPTASLVNYKYEWLAPTHSGPSIFSTTQRKLRIERAKSESSRVLDTWSTWSSKEEKLEKLGVLLHVNGPSKSHTSRKIEFNGSRSLVFQLPHFSVSQSRVSHKTVLQSTVFLKAKISKCWFVCLRL